MTTTESLRTELVKCVEALKYALREHGGYTIKGQCEKACKEAITHAEQVLVNYEMPAESLEASASPRQPQAGVGIQTAGAGSIPDAGNLTEPPRSEDELIQEIDWIIENGKIRGFGLLYKIRSRLIQAQRVPTKDARELEEKIRECILHDAPDGHTRIYMPKIMALIETALSAARQEVPEGCILIPNHIIEFLRGEGKLDGIDFNEVNDRELNHKPPRRYWWRRYLRHFIPISAAPQPTTGEKL
jgi:hypothetical protein